jgi:outer membrane lipoprotein LolB
MLPRMNSGARARLFLLSLSLTLLSACAHAPKSGYPRAEAWESRRVKLEAVQHWRLRARIGAVTDAQSGSADLQWEQRGMAFTLRVTGAFGRGLVAIEGDAISVSMQSGKGEKMSAASAQELILRQTGWLIPVDGLRHWVLGLPSGLYADEDYGLDDAGRIATLRGGGWEVEYQRYGAHAGYELPERLHMRNEQVKIKLAIIDWEILQD